MAQCNLKFIYFNFHLPSFPELNFRNLNSNLTYFNLKLTNFDMIPEYLKLNLTDLDLNLTNFNLCLTYFNLRLTDQICNQCVKLGPEAEFQVCI